MPTEHTEDPYWVDPDTHRIKHTSISAAIRSKYGQLLEVLRGNQNKSAVDKSRAKAGLISTLHPSEKKITQIIEQADEQFNFMDSVPHVRVLHPHLAAEMLDRRTYIKPISQSEFDGLTVKDAFELVLAINGQGLDEMDVNSFLHLDYDVAKLLQLRLNDASELYDRGKTEAAQEAADTAFNELKPSLEKLITGGKLSGGEDAPTFYLGRKIDLNRQFSFPEELQSLEEILEYISYPEAKMLLQFLIDHSDLEYLFTVHEDPEFGNKDRVENQLKEDREGFYFYDCVGGEASDEHKALVDQLRDQLVATLRNNNFYILNGLDDYRDRILGHYAHDGYIYQPLIDKQGHKQLDNTIECFAVELGRRKLIKMKRSFCFEIPGNLGDERKKQMLQIIERVFILPFLAAVEIKTAA